MAVPSEPDPSGPEAESRVERKRRERRRRFVDAAKRIVADEGFDALTMQRLADDLDMAVSAVYRYFDSKGALVREVQIEATEQLTRSLDASRARFEEMADGRGPAAGSPERALARVVLVGRWFCTAQTAFPEDLRLLQMIMSRRSSVLDDGGGWAVLPVAMELVGRVVAVVEAAQMAGALDEGVALDRGLVWATALSGVLQADDLEQYAPDLFGGSRLAFLANLDLVRGWGAPAELLARADAFVVEVAAVQPLAP